MPPGPVQASEKLLLAAVRGPVVAVPASGLAPVQLLLAGVAVAVQPAALFEVHVNVEAKPLGTDTGLALNEIVGTNGGVTVTVTDLETSPPAPEQASEKVLVTESAPVDVEPDVALLPDHAPEAVHKVAFVELHVNVAEPPLGTVVGLAASVSVGAGGAASTTTVTDRVAVPPGPVQDKVKVLVTVKASLDCDPAVVLLPDHAPEAAHELALVDDQVSVDMPPLVTVVGLALSVTAGAAGGGDPTTTTVTDCVVGPPRPEHVKENALLETRGPMLCEPDVGFGPDQAPDAVHDVAFVEDQCSVVEPLTSTVVGSALS